MAYLIPLLRTRELLSEVELRNICPEQSNSLFRCGKNIHLNAHILDNSMLIECGWMDEIEHDRPFDSKGSGAGLRRSGMETFGR